jgi:hypothetical protein
VELSPNLLAELVVTLVGIFVGTLAAFALERRRERARNRQRAVVLLRSLRQELDENAATLKGALPAYESTPWGKSFYVSTSAWETAISSQDLPAIIGFELADILGDQYALLFRVRYYVDLLTRLWMAPTTIEGYEELRKGFRDAIRETMSKAIGRHNHLVRDLTAQGPATSGPH